MMDHSQVHNLDISPLYKNSRNTLPFSRLSTINYFGLASYPFLKMRVFFPFLQLTFNSFLDQKYLLIKGKMHFDQKQMKEQVVPQGDLYSLEPPIQKVSQQKVAHLTKIARHYFLLENKFKSEPFFSRQEYYIISAKWLKRWKVFVGYEINSALPLGRHVGCGKIPTANEDIVESIKVGSFDFVDPLDHLKIRLKPDLQQGKDFEYIGKEMFFCFQQCEQYAVIKVPRKVVKTKDGKKVQLYHFNFHSIVLFNSYCRDIEQNRTEKFFQVHFQYSPYSTVKELIEDVFPYVKKILEAKYRPTYSMSSAAPSYSSMKAWTLKEDLQKNIFFNTLRQGCKANSTFEYKLYFQGQYLQNDKCLNDCDLSILTQFVFEILEDGKNWMFFNSKLPIEGVCSNCRSMAKLTVLCSCKYAAYCSSACKSKDKFAHKTRCPNDAESQQEQQPLKLTSQSRLGKVGLRNLGNTCFMNSGLQCISHIAQLAEYFIKDKYIEEINKINPLGTKGELSTYFAKMLQNLWYGNESAFAPTKLKKAIGKFQPMFSGYNQHDSSELINYLLDGLHEDLNRVKEKPYVQIKDYDGRDDKIVAQEAWQAFLKRNKSIIVDHLYGQYKSIVDCPKCQYQSIQFDPFLMLSLPLINSNKKSIQMIFIKDHSQQFAVNISYDIKDRVTFKYAFLEVKKQLKLPNEAKMVAYAVSYSTFEMIEQDQEIEASRKEYYSRTYYIRELMKGEDPENDTKVYLTNKVKQTSYSYYSRKSISSARVYFFSKDLTYKQVHYKIYSYFKKFYEVSNYQNDVIKADEKEKPFKILTIPQSRYSSCQYCGKKDCDGCELKYGDEKFLSDVKSKSKSVEMDIQWIKNSKQIQQRMDETRVSDSNAKAAKSSGIKISDCFNLFQEPEILAEDNAWYCPKCKEFVLAKKQMQIYKAPKILIIALKRFKRKEYFSEKHTIFVDYPVNGLDLTELVINPSLPNDHSNTTDQGSKVIYDLIAVSNHMGSTGGGHYTAYCKDITDQVWYEFDDSHISLVKDPQEVVSAAGYVLFYRRRQ